MVAHEIGPSHPSVERARRMASEDSARDEQPFLLIVRTRRIVTAELQ
jgi:hypothetical protein